VLRLLRVLNDDFGDTRLGQLAGLLRPGDGLFQQISDSLLQH